MQRKSESLRYYLLSLSNFISALGGGMILGRAIKVIQIPFLENGSIVAFFLGTVLGLIFMQSIPNKVAHVAARYFSMCSALSSLILILILKTFANTEKIIGIAGLLFFLVLSVRFAFWFYSRVLRAASVAGQQQRVAWVELGYYLGMIGGLIIWNFLNIDITILTLLQMDIVLQLLAGSIDFYINKRMLKQRSKQKDYEPIKNTRKSQLGIPFGFWRLATTVTLMTVGVQVIIFSVAHLVPDHFSPYILASFYLGASTAAIYCKKFNTFLWWNELSDTKGYSAISIYKVKNVKSIWLFISSAICAAVTILLTTSASLKLTQETLILLFVYGSSFFYEVLALSILDRIGLEYLYSSDGNKVIRTYGMMGTSAAISLWIFGIMKNSTSTLFLALGACILFASMIINKKILGLHKISSY